jgi:hypothetical protein
VLIDPLDRLDLGNFRLTIVGRPTVISVPGQGTGAIGAHITRIG